MSSLATRASQKTRTLSEMMQRIYMEEGRRPVVPILGYPGLRLTKSTIKQNQFNHQIQYQTVSRLYDEFKPDAMMFLMDLSVEASALGLKVRFPLDDTPSVEEHPISDVSDLELLSHMDVLADGRAMVFLEVISHMRRALPIPVGAYITGPFTLAGLLMGANDLALGVALNPELCEKVLEFSTTVVRRYARALVDNGADFLVILDPTSVMLGPNYYDRFAGRYVRELIGLMDDTEMILHICGDTNHLLKSMATTGCAGVSLDSMMDMAHVCDVLGPDIAVIGNVNPVDMMTDSPQQVYKATWDLTVKMAQYPQFVLSTGCDLPETVPLENVKAFMDAGRAWNIDMTNDDEADIFPVADANSREWRKPWIRKSM